MATERTEDTAKLRTEPPAQTVAAVSLKRARERLRQVDALVAENRARLRRLNGKRPA